MRFVFDNCIQRWYDYCIQKTIGLANKAVTVGKMPSPTRKENYMGTKTDELLRNPGQKFDAPQLAALAARFRMEMFDILHQRGTGHWGGAASAAELTTALYFNRLHIDPANPRMEDRDRFILSKGHASVNLYTILANRGFFPTADLPTFRTLGSHLQGHPAMNKTPGVDMSTGALGHGISIGLGMALASQLSEKKYWTYVLTGEGCLNEGQSWEAMMCASKFKPHGLVLMIDYNKVQLDGSEDQIMPLAPLDEKLRAFGWNVCPQAYNGNNTCDILSSFDWMDSDDVWPKAVIYDTTKGKGVSFTEGKNTWHGAVIDDASYEAGIVELRKRPCGKGGGTMSMAMRDAFGKKLAELGATHPELVVLDADVSSSTKSAYFAKAFPQRFFNCGVAEGNMADVAAGLATCGYHPVINSFAIFLALKGTDQLRNVACYNNLPIIIAGAYGGLSDSFDGASHQSVCDIAIMRSLPNMQVLVPSDARQAEQALEYALQQKGPVYIRLNRNAMPDLPESDDFASAKAIVVSQGKDLTIAANGITASKALEAAQVLSEQGIEATVLSVPFVKPLDGQGILHSALQSGRLLTVEEHVLMGGFGSAVSEVVARSGNALQMDSIGLDDCFGETGPYEALLAEYGISAKNIADKARALCAR